MRVIGRLREWSGVVALLLVVAGGTAYAANEWTGANIVDESLTGADVRGSSAVDGSLTGLDVKANTLRGSDVDESSLEQVPDAAELGGMGPSRFVRGAAAVPGAFGVSNAKAYFNRVQNIAGSTSTFMEIPGLLDLELECTAGDAVLYLAATRDDLEIFTHWSRSGIVDRNVLDNADRIGFSANSSAQTQHLEVQAGIGENTFGLQKQVDVTAFMQYTPGGCLARASALAQQT